MERKEERYGTWKKGIVYCTKSDSFLYCHWNFAMYSCVDHVSEWRRRKNSEFGDHNYIYSCIDPGRNDGREKNQKTQVYVGIVCGNVILSDLNKYIAYISGKYHIIFSRADHGIFLMYCWRNFRWNACYLKKDMIQYSKLFYENQEDDKMKHIKTLTNKTLQNTVKKGGCGECQTSCQSACKTSCTVGNQTCEHSK